MQNAMFEEVQERRARAMLETVLSIVAMGGGFPDSSCIFIFIHKVDEEKSFCT